ncbi:MAG: hypothetical protein KF822_09535 [Steroidobacteraceae bacterium]|nr:hypothetical protein [Steroidobacteraceae bacterium]
MIPLSYLAGAAFAAGITLGGTAAWWYQGTRIDELQLSNLRFRAAAEVSEQIERRKREQAEATVAALTTDLAQAYRMRQEVHDETVKEITAVASPRAQCLAPATRGVLNRRAGGGRAAEGPDPRVALGVAPAPASDPSGPAAGASEQAVALWMTAALDQYVRLRDQHAALAKVVRALPCVEIVP